MVQKSGITKTRPEDCTCAPSPTLSLASSFVSQDAVKRELVLADINAYFWQVGKMRNPHKSPGGTDARILVFRQGFGIGSACRFIGKIKKGHKAP